MKTLTLSTIALEAGSDTDIFRKRLMSNGAFMQVFNKLHGLESGLSDWCNSHVSMSNFSEAFEAEKARLNIDALRTEAVVLATAIKEKAIMRME